MQDLRAVYWRDRPDLDRADRVCPCDRHPVGGLLFVDARRLGARRLGDQRLGDQRLDDQRLDDQNFLQHFLQSQRPLEPAVQIV